MSSKSKNVIKTQYVYVNSKNAPGASPYQIKLFVPRGLLQCDDQTQSFRITVQDFNMVASWYYVNRTNSGFKIVLDTIEWELSIPYGNYSFKQLASAITNEIKQSPVTGKEGISAAWNSRTNKLEFTFPSEAYKLSFQNIEDSAASVFGFTDGIVYETMGNLQIISDRQLRTTLSENITLWIDNLSPNKDYQSLENKYGNVCEPCTNIMNITNNFAPFDVISWENNNDLYAIIVNEKQLDNLVFSIRDENGQLMEYVSDWRASIKIETLADDSYYDRQIAMLQEMKEMREYLKFIFLQKNM